MCFMRINIEALKRSLKIIKVNQELNVNGDCVVYIGSVNEFVWIKMKRRAFRRLLA